MDRGRGGRGGSRGQGRGNCITYKFLGQCEKQMKGECRFRHEFMLPNPCSEYVPVPEGMSVGMVIGSGGCNIKQLRSIAECHIDVKKDRVLIVTENQEKLQMLVAKLKLIMSQESVPGSSYCFIHPRAVSSHGSYGFREYKGTKVVSRAQTKAYTMYELRGLTQESGCDDGGELVRTSLQRMHIATPGGAEGLDLTRMQFRPQENIRMSLDESLKALSEKKKQQKFIARLEARFGRMTWLQFPDSMYSKKYTIESLADLLFAKHSGHNRNIFNTDVKATNAENVRPSEGYGLETFNVQLTTTYAREETKLDACLLVMKNDDGNINLEVLMVTKNDIKDATFNILNLHREHDLRIRLSHCDYVQEDDPLHAIVRKMVEKISFPSQHKVRIQSNPMQWKVRFIRHKKKFTYMVDGNFAITVADISEHNFEGMNEGEFDMREKGHVEVELQNLAWESVFCRDGGLSSDQSLATHIESGKIKTHRYDTIPCPWQPEHILRDFYTFWGHLDTLSDRLDGLKLK